MSGAPRVGADSTDAARPAPSLLALLPYLVAGAVFGLVIVKAEVVSWYRIQEMFRFQSFHMYGVLATASFTAFIALRVLMWTRARSASGEEIAITPKTFEKGHRYWIGGGVFGVGWAFSGACPGPLFALVGGAGSVFVVVVAAAIVGAWTYGHLRERLPH